MKRSVSPFGPGKPRAVQSVGGASRVGPSGAAPKPRLPKVKNTRDYGKLEPAPELANQPSPFGSVGGF